MASLSRVIEPRTAQRPFVRRPAARAPADQVAVAQAMTRQAAVLRTSVKVPEADLPSEHWYRREDPYTSAETDAAFAAFMAGDNPHVRTDEVPVVDFTSMIPRVDPDGRPIGHPSQRGSRIKVGLAALATVVILSVAAAFGVVEIPGVDRVVPDMFRSNVSASTADGSDGAQPTQPAEVPDALSSTPADDGGATGDVGEQPLSITGD